VTQPEQPVLHETFVFFVKTNKAFHQGGFVFFDVESFREAKAMLENEVRHLLGQVKEKDPGVEFESWGAISSLTGEIVEQFTDYPGE
jgi:hypothetical protein